MRDWCKAIEIYDLIKGRPLYFVEGMDKYIEGVGIRAGKPCVIYNRTLIIERLMDKLNVNYAKAEKHLELEIENQKLGCSSPIFAVECSRKHLELALEDKLKDPFTE